jgi:multicomponent Na+:H+ antiporter subunit B
MNSRAKTIIFILFGISFGLLLVRGFAGLPRFGDYRGPYGNIINRVAIPQRQCQQSVAAVTFDYRGFDTLNEEYILFAAVTGVTLLLRRQKHEDQKEPVDQAPQRHLTRTSDMMTLAGIILFPLTLLFGIYVILHGHLTPGGGFQGGVIVASGFLYVYLSGEYSLFEKAVPERMAEILEAIGAGGFVLLGFIGWLGWSGFMLNFLPFGDKGQLVSAGILPLLNLTVGLEVAMGILIVLSSFLRQTLEFRLRRKP